MTVSSEDVLQKIEEVTKRVIDVLVRNQPQTLEALVIEQCFWLRELTRFPVDQVDRGRVRTIYDQVKQQQALIQQAQETSEFFARKISPSSGFGVLG